MINATETLQAQPEFMHSAGGEAIFELGSTSEFGNTYGFQAIYFPRVSFAFESENAAVSAGIPLGVGYNYFKYEINGSNFEIKDYGFGFTLNVPVMADVNIGHGSTKENGRYKGGYAGAGFDFRIDKYFTDFFDGRQIYYGPKVHGGMRFVTRGNNMSWTVFASYAYHANVTGHMAGLGFHYNIGLD